MPQSGHLGPTAGTLPHPFAIATAHNLLISGLDSNSFTHSKAGGRKRHIVTDTLGHLVAAKVHAADLQDRDGAPALLVSIRYLFPWLRHVFADGGYAGDKLTAALAAHGKWRIAIVKRCDQATGFQVLPRRWVVERTLARLSRNRRIAKHFEATLGSSEAWIYLASNCLRAVSLGLQLNGYHAGT